MAMRFREHQAQARAATRRLLLLFVAVLALLLLAVNGVLALIYRLSFPWTSDFPALFFETNSGLVLLFVLGGCWFEMLRLREGGPHLAKLAGGRCISPPEGQPHDLYEKRLRNVVDEVAIACGVRRTPSVYVLAREEAINAFAAGWGFDDAVIAITRGALERLTRDELQGVVAHEFSHLVHGDTRLNMRLVGLVWGLQMLYNFGHSLVEPDERDRRGAAVLFGLGLMAVGSLGWLAGRLLKAAVARQREYLADASAVQFTRSPDGIGNALRKIADQSWRRQDGLRSVHAESLSHLFFVSRLRWEAFATHPPLHERIRRLYGHTVGPLPARQLAPEDDDEPDTLPMRGEPLVPPRAPMRAASPTPRPRPRPDTAAAAPPGPTEAQQHDPVQRAAGGTREDGEREALARIRRWHGPGERKAGVLALLLTPGNAAEAQAFEQETGGGALPVSVRADIERLGEAARLPVFELLLRRSAATPVGERRALLKSSRRVMGADGRTTPLDRLRWLAMRQLLAGGPPSRPCADQPLAQLSKELAVVHAFLARIVVADSAGAGAQPGAEGSPWYRAVWRALLGDQPVPAWRSPDGDRFVTALEQLARLPAVRRPLLLRTWVEVAQQLVPQGRLDAASADALRVVALLIDTPCPKPLSDLFVEVGEP
ncbi:M48 family metallopeptidase [Caldimonas brevitalea]|uniref:Peptidase M48 domain-containing protein n=1 Tax=Caldimonas brevitalea TaxID=413882 RepID=A0A0G3BCE1_9BURK|nr:M48 family metallopeptidase [Caldimonas brevitalea]AKJ27034.1 hypothetical protein AAW51_0343 [Caldimonas brevitalea]